MTGMPVLGSMCWARSSASTTCWVKNFEPIVILVCGGLLHAEKKQVKLRRYMKQRNRNWTRRILGDLQSTLDKPEQKICEERKESGRDGAGEDKRIADKRDAPENERAEAAGADGGSDRGNADSDDRRRANTGKNHTEGHRETDPETSLPHGQP